MANLSDSISFNDDLIEGIHYYRSEQGIPDHDRKIPHRPRLVLRKRLQALSNHPKATKGNTNLREK